jgi:hypothetical protein
MFVCETAEEAVSVAEDLAASEEWEEVLIVDTSEAGAQPVICGLSWTTPLDNVSNATATSLETLLKCVVARLNELEPQESRQSRSTTPLESGQEKDCEPSKQSTKPKQTN